MRRFCRLGVLDSMLRRIWVGVGLIGDMSIENLDLG